MISVITGKPRHGKTYFLATIIADLLKHNERIFSNLYLNLGVGALKKISPDIIGDYHKEEDRKNPEKRLFYWRHIHEWEHFEKGTIICDEMTTYFNPRQWELLSEDTEIKLRQHGKEDLDLWGTTQHYTRIDVALRQLVENFYIIRTIFGNPNNKKPFLGLKRFSIVRTDLEDIENYYRSKMYPDMKIDIDVQEFRRWFRKKYAVIYDTRQAVAKSESVPLVHKSRICPICGEEKITHK